MFRENVDDGDIIELEDVYINGYFIGEENEYYLFQEVDVEPNLLLDIWRIEKKRIRYEPEMNIYGYLKLDDSQFAEEREGKWYISEGMGALMLFYSNPF